MNRQKKELEKERRRLLLDITPIDSFFGKYRFLSNFYPAQVRIDDILYPSTEAAYQACKTLDVKVRQQFTFLTAAQAKKLGNEIECRDDWEGIKVQVMREVLQAKFLQDYFRRQLDATRPRMLVEGNHWHDTFWGVCNGRCKQAPHAPFGKNQLGELLMEIRDGQVFRSVGR